MTVHLLEPGNSAANWCGAFGYSTSDPSENECARCAEIVAEYAELAARKVRLDAKAPPPKTPGGDK